MAWQRSRAYALDLRIVSWQRQGGFAKSSSALVSARALNCRHVPLRLAKLKDSLLAPVALALEQTLRQLCQ